VEGEKNVAAQIWGQKRHDDELKVGKIRGGVQQMGAKRRVQTSGRVN